MFYKIRVRLPRPQPTLPALVRLCVKIPGALPALILVFYGYIVPSLVCDVVEKLSEMFTMAVR